MRRRVLEVDFHSAHDCIVRGPGAGQILIGLTGRQQVYSPSRRGYSVQERTARNAIAAAERLGYDVTVAGPRSAPARDVTVAASKPEGPTPPETESSLW
jgi:hypothetical protein